MYDNLKKELYRGGVTKTELAEAAGVSIQTVCRRLNGGKHWKPSEMRDIQKNLFPDLELEYLFNNTAYEIRETVDEWKEHAVMYAHLEKAIKQKGLCPAEIAAAMNMHVTTLYRKLNRAERLRLCEAVRLRDRFFPGMSIDYLFSVGKE